MAIVTGIVESGRSDGRFVLEIDGKGGPVVSLDILDRLDLRLGATIDDLARARLDEEAAALKTYDRALSLLAFQAR